MFILVAQIGLVPPTNVGGKKQGSFELPPTANQMYDFVENLFKVHGKDLQKARKIQRENDREKLRIIGLKNFPVELEVASGSVMFDRKKYKYSLKLSSKENNTGYNRH